MIKYSRELIAHLIDVYHSGKSLPVIAKEYNIPINLLRNRTYGKINKRPFNERTKINSHETFIENITHNDNGCWKWNKGLNNKGYGQFSIKNKLELAHRYSYTFFKGDCKGQFVCHSCDNPKCVNPDHLFLGDYNINSLDKMKKTKIKHNKAIHRSSYKNKAAY